MDTISQSNINTDLYSKYSTLDTSKNLQENTNTFRNPLQKIDSKNLSISQNPASSFLLASGGLDFALKALKRNIESLQKEKQTIKLKNGNLELELSQSLEQNKILESENLALASKNQIYEQNIQELKAKVQALIDAKQGNIANASQITPVIPTTTYPQPPQQQQPQQARPQAQAQAQAQLNAINPVTPLNPMPINSINTPPTTEVKHNIANPNDILHDVADFLDRDNPTDQLNTLLDKDLGTKEPAIKTILPEIIDSGDIANTPIEHPVNFDDAINQQAQKSPSSLEDHEEFNNFLSKNNTPAPTPQPKDFVMDNNIPNISNPVPNPMVSPSVNNIMDQNHNNINQISKNLNTTPVNTTHINSSHINSSMKPKTPPPQQQRANPNPNPNNNPIPNLDLRLNK